MPKPTSPLNSVSLFNFGAAGMPGTLSADGPTIRFSCSSRSATGLLQLEQAIRIGARLVGDGKPADMGIAGREIALLERGGLGGCGDGGRQQDKPSNPKTFSLCRSQLPAEPYKS